VCVGGRRIIKRGESKGDEDGGMRIEGNRNQPLKAKRPAFLLLFYVMLCGLGSLFPLFVFFFPAFFLPLSHFTFIYIVRNVAILLLGHMRSSPPSSFLFFSFPPPLCAFYLTECECVCGFLIFALFVAFILIQLL